MIGEGEPVTVWIASDIHFLSPDLTDGGTLFSRTVENGDGKMVGASPMIVDAFIEEVLPQNDLLSTGFVLDNHADVSELLEKNKVETNEEGSLWVELQFMKKMRD